LKNVALSALLSDCKAQQLLLISLKTTVGRGVLLSLAKPAAVSWQLLLLVADG